MLSLAKLAHIASDEPDEKVELNMRRIDHELNLIAHQEDVPVHVLEIYGYDVEKLRVLSPSELINVNFLNCFKIIAITKYLIIIILIKIFFSYILVSKVKYPMNMTLRKRLIY